MKQTVKTIVALFAVTALFVSLAACTSGSNKKLMQGIYEKLIENASYTAWKNGYSGSTIDETIDGDSIVIHATGEEGVNGDYTFTLDGDYIVVTGDADDYSSYSLLMFIRDAIADYYGMNSMLMSGILAASDDGSFFQAENVDGKVTYKLYAASAWEMDGLDKVYIDDEAISHYKPLAKERTAIYVNKGKVSAAALGSAKKLALFVGEYGENTEMTYQSILSIVKQLQPKGYKDFVKSFTELKDLKGDGYTVSLTMDEGFAAEQQFTPVEGYSYVVVTFGAK